MVKNGIRKRVLFDTSLVVAGWTLFAVGMFIADPSWKLLVMAAARVLP